MTNYYIVETADFNNERLIPIQIKSKNLTEAKKSAVKNRKFGDRFFIKIYENINHEGFGENLLVSKNTIPPYKWTRW